MKLAILQPGYLPWLGFFDQVARVDTFVIFDDAQYDKGSWRNRNRIKTVQGPLMLTVPVITSGRLTQRINETRIDNRQGWRKAHWQSVRQAYGKAPYFADHADFFDSLYKRDWEFLVDLDLEIIQYLTRAFGFSTQIIRSSALRGISGQKNERLLSLCHALGATSYLTGDAAESYLDEEAFLASGIGVEYQRYRHPEYPQLHGAFVPYLSAIDLLFNCGPESGLIVQARPQVSLAG